MAKKDKKSGWSFLKGLAPEDTPRYRDVYEKQQLGTSDLQEEKGKGRYAAIAAVGALLITLVFYFILCMVTGLISSMGLQIGGALTDMSQPGMSSGGYDLSQVAAGDYGLKGFGTSEADPILMRIPVSHSDGETGYVIVQYWNNMTEDAFTDRLADMGWTPDGPITMSGMTSPNGDHYGTDELDALFRRTQEGWDWAIYQGHMFDEYAGKNTGEGVLNLDEVQLNPNTYVASNTLGQAEGIKIGSFFKMTAWKFFACLLVYLLSFAFLYLRLLRIRDAENTGLDPSALNQNKNDQHIALPEELQVKFDWFPDVGAHSSVQVSSMISHMALLNKGLDPVQMVRRAKRDIKDDDGEVKYYKGEPILAEDGSYVVEEKPMIDEGFMDDLFTASGAPKSKSVRLYYDARKIPYNAKNEDREKQKDCDTVADLINKDWELPDYEPQRPGGAYLVDTAPVNTMVLAITRAGKGQTVIEPTIDMWTREKSPNNMVINTAHM